MNIKFDSQSIEKIKNYLIHVKQTIAVAESVTSGFMQAALGSAEQASEFYEGGITVYNIDQKVRHLGINRSVGEACNCVSLEISEQMVLGVVKLFDCHFGISITGYATPVRESDHKLYAYYSICMQNKIKETGRIDLPEQKPEEAQMEYVNRILKRLSALVNGD